MASPEAAVKGKNKENRHPNRFLNVCPGHFAGHKTIWGYWQKGQPMPLVKDLLWGSSFLTEKRFLVLQPALLCPSANTGHFNQVTEQTCPCLFCSSASKYSSMDMRSWSQKPSVYPCGGKLLVYDSLEPSEVSCRQHETDSVKEFIIINYQY